MQSHRESGKITGLSLMDAMEAKTLRSYLPDERGTVADSEQLAARLIDLQGRLDSSLKTSVFPVIVSTEDVQELVLPAINSAVCDAYRQESARSQHDIAEPDVDYRHEVISTLV